MCRDCAETHSGPKEGTGRFGISSGTSVASGMDSNPTSMGLAPGNVAVGSSVSGTIRQPVEPPTSPIRVPMSGRSSNPDRRSTESMATGGSTVRLPSPFLMSPLLLRLQKEKSFRLILVTQWSPQAKWIPLLGPLQVLSMNHFPVDRPLLRQPHWNHVQDPPSLANLRMICIMPIG